MNYTNKIVEGFQRIMYSIVFSKEALKSSTKIPKNYLEVILKKIKTLAKDPYNSTLNIKMLQHSRQIYRLRVGDYRVIYEIDNEKYIIHIIKIGTRGGIYDSY